MRTRIPDFAPVGRLKSSSADAPDRPPKPASRTDRPTVAGSFADFYRANFHPLVVLVAAVAKDDTFAEDIVQETMSLVHDRWQELQSRNTSRAWARRTAVNKAIDRKRRVGRERKAASKLWQPDSQPTASIENRPLWDEVRALPTKQRIAVVLFYVDGYSTDEIAEVLNCSGSAARTILHRARNTLSRKLGSRSTYEGRLA